MRKLRALIGVGIKTQFPLTVLWRQAQHGPGSGRAVTIMVLVGAALVPLLFAFCSFITTMFNALHLIGQESVLVAVAALTGQLVVFVFGLFYVISAFYFSNDLEVLIPLPVRPGQVVLSKLIVVMISEYITILLLVLPVWLGYGILARAPLSYWCLLVPVFLLLPAIPLTLSALLAIGLMRVVNLSKRKDALVVVGTLLAFALQLFVNLRSRSVTGGAGAFARSLAQDDSLIRLVGRNFPPSIWASRSLTLGFSGEGLGQFALLLGVSCAVFLALAALAERLFYQGAIGLNEIAAKRRRFTLAEMEKRVSAGHHPLRALFQREVRLMNRTPIFLLNGVLVVIFIPMSLVVVAAPWGGGQELGDLFRRLGSLSGTSSVLTMAAFLLACGSLNSTAASAFSREGRHFWISKVIPVTWRQQVAAKFLHSYVISVLGFVTGGMTAAVTLGIPARTLLPAALLALAGAAALTTFGLSIDLARPLLKWTNPQAAVKQNLNVLAAMIVQTGFVAACGLAARLLMKLGLSGVLVCLLMLMIALWAAGIAWRRLLTMAERRYPDIEA